MKGRRQFDANIVEDKAFSRMCATTQALYFHLNMLTDDEGFTSNIETAMDNVPKCSERNLQQLVNAGYIIQFDTGIILITDFDSHNANLSNKQPTIYEEEKAQVEKYRRRWRLKE